AGFSMEIAIPWADLHAAQPADGSTIGYDVGFNDWDNDTSRDYKLMWSGTTNNDTKSDDLGTLHLSQEYAPELTFTELWEAPANDCSNPRNASWDISAIHDSPVRLVSWMYYQTVANTGCTPGAADVWFDIAMPAYSNVRIEAVNNRDFNVSFIRKLSDDCAVCSCEAVRNSDETASLYNNTASVSRAAIVISAEDLEIDDISYISFIATNINR
ncbi:MAG: hypothetical protein JXX14_03355, partial [Deltaproteobacteria bacterium]|nr:hypothetical protein [Deltaproteobacteria bacterium]